MSIDIVLGKSLGQEEMFGGTIEMKGCLGGRMRMLNDIVNKQIDG